MDEALEWRNSIDAAKGDPSFYRVHDDDGDLLEDGEDLSRHFLTERATQIEAQEGYVRAEQFHSVATGKATLVATLIESWLAQKDMKPRQIIDYRLETIATMSDDPLISMPTAS